MATSGAHLGQPRWSRPSHSLELYVPRPFRRDLGLALFTRPTDQLTRRIHTRQVVGQLVFGYTADRWSRTNSLLISTIILIVFTALAAGSYYHGDTIGMFNILAAWRFFVSRILVYAVVQQRANWTGRSELVSEVRIAVEFHEIPTKTLSRRVSGW